MASFADIPLLIAACTAATEGIPVVFPEVIEEAKASHIGEPEPLDLSTSFLVPALAGA